MATVSVFSKIESCDNGLVVNMDRIRNRLTKERKKMSGEERTLSGVLKSSEWVMAIEN